MIQAINTIEDVKVFFNQLLDESLNFHPDDDFGNYINVETKEATYTDEEAGIRNALMDEAFVVCERHDTCIYDLAQGLSLKYTGQDTLFPDKL